MVKNIILLLFLVLVSCLFFNKEEPQIQSKNLIKKDVKVLQLKIHKASPKKPLEGQKAIFEYENYIVKKFFFSKETGQDKTYFYQVYTKKSRILQMTFTIKD